MRLIGDLGSRSRRWQVAIRVRWLTLSARRICWRMSTPLSSAEIQQALGELPGWALANNSITKTFAFVSFREALSFMVRVGFEAEALNHHPEWTNVYNRVEVKLNTHDAGGKVTAKDVELARRVQKISWVG